MGGFFPPPTGTERVLTPLIVFSLKSLEDHLLCSRKFAQIVGNILIAIQLATTEKEVVEEPIGVSGFEVAKGQLTRHSNHTTSTDGAAELGKHKEEGP
jgi:hypothetical protein